VSDEKSSESESDSAAESVGLAQSGSPAELNVEALNPISSQHSAQASALLKITPEQRKQQNIKSALKVCVAHLCNSLSFLEANIQHATENAGTGAMKNERLHLTLSGGHFALTGAIRQIRSIWLQFALLCYSRKMRRCAKWYSTDMFQKLEQM
jgi:hypothetical protein